MQFTKLRVKNWRNFWKPAEVTLADRVFIVGPNASGKSNLLDVFRFLRDLVPPHGNFQKAVESRGGVQSLRCLAARRDPVVSVGVDLNLGDSGHWTYDLSFAQKGFARPEIQLERVTHNGKAVLERPDEADRSDKLRLTQTALEQINANRAFRAVAEFFAKVSYQHLIPQVVREPDRFTT
ncbi:MAG: AAA family ATPase, partial [Planctomycetes bacterium]|nr:AAA family ATPase [Planctomycetota bacterium]